VTRSTSARVRRVHYSAPSARLTAPRPALNASGRRQADACAANSGLRFTLGVFALILAKLHYDGMSFIPATVLVAPVVLSCAGIWRGMALAPRESWQRASPMANLFVASRRCSNTCRGNLARVRSGGTTVRSHVAHKYGQKCFLPEYASSLSPNYAFERPGSLSSRARVRRARHCAPSARLKRLRPAPQRER